MRHLLLPVLPVLLWSHVALSAPSLDAALEEITSDRVFRKADVGLQVVDLRSGEEVFAHQADKLMSPASTTKVVTAATALKHLGPTYRFQTTILADASPDAAGKVAGDLYIRGGGDPTLVIEKLWKMVVDLRLAGVKHIEGDVVFDESFFEINYALPGWTKPEDIERGPTYFPAISALSLNFNTVALIVRPGASVGKAGHTGLETPAEGYVKVVNKVKTGPSTGRRSIQITREVAGDHMVFTVAGTIPERGRTARYYRTVADPTAHLMAVLAGQMAQQGITVSGQSVRGTTPDTATEILTLQSRPLAVVLMDMNKFSSNFMAEQVLRTIGAEVGGAPGTTTKGLAVVGAYLTSLGLTEADFDLVNGSGLSYDARLTATALTTVLLDMYRDRQVAPEFASSLALAGLDGTLASRLEETPGLLRGKTGTVNGVHCLTGYMTGGDGRDYAFAFMVNEIPGGIAQVKALQDRFAMRLLSLGTGEAGETADKQR
jgi:D-alanyl-D-alanine carboxypeptidase/D-alanyl-D-alanine-endopeptidase (penicillin-binding protein 4)